MSSIIIMAEEEGEKRYWLHYSYTNCNTVSFVGVAAGSLVMRGSLACQGDCGRLRSLHSERIHSQCTLVHIALAPKSCS